MFTTSWNDPEFTISSVQNWIHGNGKWVWWVFYCQVNHHSRFQWTNSHNITQLFTFELLIHYSWYQGVLLTLTVLTWSSKIPKYWSSGEVCPGCAGTDRNLWIVCGVLRIPYNKTTSKYNCLIVTNTHRFPTVLMENHDIRSQLLHKCVKPDTGTAYYKWLTKVI